MSESFDPYYKWLGIPPDEQPPDHYRLLAIRRFESDADVIDAAAEQRMTLLRSRQTGKYAAASQQLLNEISAARGCLLDAQRRADYDEQLRREASEVSLPAPVPVAPLSAPLDDLPIADPLAAPPPTATLANIAAKPTAYGATHYGNSKPAAAFPMPLLLGVAGALLVGVFLVAAVGFAVLGGSSAPPDVPPEMAPQANKPTRKPNDPPIEAALRNEPATANSPPPAVPESIDLLSQIDIERDSIKGDFALQDGVLIVPAIRAGQLEIAAVPPPNYRLELEIERMSGEGSLNVGLVCGDADVMVAFDSFEPKGTGLNLLDRRSADRNETTRRGVLFPLGAPHQVVCTVHPGEINVTCDGETIIDWRGDTSRLDIDKRFWQPRHRPRLRFVSWGSEFRIRQMRLTELPARASAVGRNKSCTVPAFLQRRADANAYSYFPFPRRVRRNVLRLFRPKP